MGQIYGIIERREKPLILPADADKAALQRL